MLKEYRAKQTFGFLWWRRTWWSLAVFLADGHLGFGASVDCSWQLTSNRFWCGHRSRKRRPFNPDLLGYFWSSSDGCWTYRQWFNSIYNYYHLLIHSQVKNNIKWFSGKEKDYHKTSDRSGVLHKHLVLDTGWGSKLYRYKPGLGYNPGPRYRPGEIMYVLLNMEIHRRWHHLYVNVFKNGFLKVSQTSFIHNT